MPLPNYYHNAELKQQRPLLEVEIAETYREAFDLHTKKKNEKLGDAVHESKKLCLEAMQYMLANPDDKKAIDIFEKARDVYRTAKSEENLTTLRTVKGWFKSNEKLDNFDRVLKRTEDTIEKVGEYNKGTPVNDITTKIMGENNKNTDLAFEIIKRAPTTNSILYDPSNPYPLNKDSIEKSNLNGRIDTLAKGLKPSDLNNNNNSKL